MAGQNERNTENLVRGMLKEQGYDDDTVIVEEQKSNNPRIVSLLQNASKNGRGVGKPEFIISFTNDNSLLIVIECKANISDHESKTRDKYKKYAVDGVLLYSAFLSKEFNVISIAVSGENENELKISNFIQLRGAYIGQELKDIQEIRNRSEYANILKEKKKPVANEELIRRAVKYNDRLNDYSMPETERCIFLSAILTAIQDEVFINGYDKHINNQELVDDTLGACERVLGKSHVKADDKKTILFEFQKIQQAKILTSATVKKKRGKEEKNTILKDFIADLIKNVLPFIRENDFDILGIFYREFIRYAGSDAKTGLVLTPTHITDFFCELAELKYNDVVLDPCCGTGGFLVSSMKFMMNSCGNKESELHEIKAKRLIGVEFRADMFTHAYSNMVMRGDGKSNIIHGDCFVEQVKKKIREKKPNKAFLNPPYDGGEIVQLEFIENALDCLEKSGLCIAICQMSVAVSMSKEAFEIRGRLLKRHTLRGVISMPSDLFHPIGVVTCILIFEAHKSHPRNKETFLGYLKDDGHVKIKNRGRLDNGTWENKKNMILDIYMNNNSKAGLSVARVLADSDEWCAEAYMETDHTTISDRDFIRSIKFFSAFEFIQENIFIASDKPFRKSKSPLNLRINEWRKFNLSDIFEISGTKTTPLRELQIIGIGKYPYVTTQATNNGVGGFFDHYSELGNCLCVDSAVIGYTSYQYQDFSASDHVEVLRLKEYPLTKFLAMFLTTIMNQETYRYNYGRKRSQRRIREEKLFLPATPEGAPDWQFMEDYIKSLPYSSNLDY